jgi:hypothetical protein
VILKPEKLTFYLLLADVVGIYMVFVIMALCQKISAIIFFGHGSLRSSVIVTMFASAYLPLVHISDYVVVTDKTSLSMALDDPSKFLENYPSRAIVIAILALIALIFLLVRFIPATRFVHRVGWLRATLICTLTILLSFQAYTFFILPLDKLLLSPAM